MKRARASKNKADRRRKMFWRPHEFAETFGLTTRQARDRLRECGALRRRGGDGPWETSEALLKSAFPEDWPAIVARLRAQPDDL